MPSTATRLLLKTMGNRGVWSDVTAPDAAFNYVPFTVQRNGSVFRADPSFVLRTYANISVTKTYYLNTVSGSDGNSGLTSVLPKKTWNAIIGTGDYDRIIIQNGSYLIRSESSLQPSRSVEVIGEGTVYFTSDRTNNLGSWSLSSGKTFTFQASTSGEFISRVLDEGTLNAQGHPTPYAVKSSIAEVEAQAGSMYWASSTVYVHTLDGLTPSGRTDLKYYDSSAISWAKNNLKFYLENINIRGGCSFTNASAAGTATKVYLKDCTAHALSVQGVNEFFAQNCTVYTAPSDTVNYDALNSVITQAIEIDCNFSDGGSNSTHQASTGHNSCVITRINGKYHHVTGQCCAEAGAGTKTWMLGSELYNSTSGIGYYNEGTAWLDRIWSHDNATYDLQNIVGATIYTRNCTLAKGVNLIAGTLSSY